METLVEVTARCLPGSGIFVSAAILINLICMSTPIKILIGVAAFIILIFLIPSSPETETVSNNEEPDFSQLSRERFDKLATEVPELSSIECEPVTCNNVAYFDYVTVPEDLEIMIRGNAATFSKFKMDNSIGSNVTVIARSNGEQLLRCDASKGAVTECN